MCTCNNEKCQVCGSCKCGDCSNACQCGNLFDSSRSESSESKKKEYGEASSHLGDFVKEGSRDGYSGVEGGNDDKGSGFKELIFGFIILCVMVLVGVLTLVVLEQTGVIIWDQTKPGVADWTTWGQYVAIGLSTGFIGLSSWGLWRLNHPKPKTD